MQLLNYSMDYTLYHLIASINILRNLAIERVNTAYYLNMDADIIPSRTIQ